MRERILEGRWDCTDCGRSGIRGRAKSCPGCGSGRDPVGQPGERPYLPAGAEDITGTELAEQLGTEADWLCDHCGQANHAAATTCRGCGQAHDEPDVTVARRVFAGIRHHIPKALPTRTRTRTAPAASSRATAVGRAPRAVAALVGSPGRRWGAAGVVAVVVAVGAWAIWAAVFATKAVTVEVTDLAWSRGVEVEEYKTLQRSSFDPPADARIRRSYQAVHHHQQVHDGYDTETRTRQVPYPSTCTRSVTVDNGNGTFSQRTESYSCTEYRSETYTTQVPRYRSEPVYRTKYDFEIDRWVTDFYVTVDDGDATRPFWPDATRAARADGHRVGDDRREQYTVVLRAGARTWRQHPDLDVWSGLVVGDELVAHVTRSGPLRAVDWPTRTAPT